MGAVHLRHDVIRKVIVTGGAGYIGSHTVVDLQRRAMRWWSWTILSNLRYPSPGRIAAITGTRPRFIGWISRMKEVTGGDD